MIADKVVMMRQTYLVTAPGYSCLRGPRPSGALLLTVNANGDTIVPIFGYVQPSAGLLSCKEHGECMMENGHCVRNLHAEVDTMLKAAKNGHSTIGAILYSINKPCYNCTLHAIAAGVKKIYYAFAVYDEDRTREALEAAGVECIHVPIDID